MAALASFRACPASRRASGAMAPSARRASTNGERFPLTAVRTALNSSSVDAPATPRAASSTNSLGSAINLHYGNLGIEEPALWTHTPHPEKPPQQFTCEPRTPSTFPPNASVR